MIGNATITCSIKLQSYLKMSNWQDFFCTREICFGFFLNIINNQIRKQQTILAAQTIL